MFLINGPEKKKKGGRKYRFRFVCPAWLKRLRERLHTVCTTVRTAVHKKDRTKKDVSPKRERRAAQQTLPLEPSVQTMRLAAIERENMGNTLRMVDLSGRIVELGAQAKGASAALDEAAQALSSLHQPLRPDDAAAPQGAMAAQQAARAAQIEAMQHAQEHNAQLAAYDNIHMAMLRPVRRRNPLVRFLQKRSLKRADQKNQKRVRRASVHQNAAPEKKRAPSRAVWIAACSVCGAIALAGGGVAAAWYAGALDGARHYVEAKEVYFDGRPVGAVVDAQVLQSAVESLYEQLSVEYGVDVLANQELVMRDALVDPKYISAPEAVTQEVRRNIEISVNAVVISIDGMSAVALEKESDAQWVLDQVLAPYGGGDGVTETRFLEDVQIAHQDVDYALLRSREDAFSLLTVGVDAAKTYTVRSGDTLWSIAENNGYSIADILRANPSISSSDVLRVGQEISLTSPQRLVNVSSKQVIEQIDTLPHETQNITDNSLYSDQTVVRQEGSDGQKKSVIQIDYVNGAEVSRTVLSEEILVEPVARIVATGTQKRPSNVSSRGYMRPVSGGRITSGFGPRVRPTAGASSYHYGVDVGVGYGTPIVATRAGTVTSAGWNGGYGYMVQVDHGGGVISRYAHCSRVLVSRGQYVAQGQQIAQVGSTGVSTGNHLHFEIRIGGTAQNPVNYVDF